MFRAQGQTTRISKRWQILIYAILNVAQRISLKGNSANSGVTLYTCCKIISEAKRRALMEYGNPNLCATENLTQLSNSSTRSNSLLSEVQKHALIELALSDATHCRMRYEELAKEGKSNIAWAWAIDLVWLYEDDLNISANTVKWVLADNGIHRRLATLKPLWRRKEKAARLPFCLKYWYLNWLEVIFTFESYCETGALQKGWVEGVLQCAEEEHIPQNMHCTFPGGVAVMFWDAILYGHVGMY